MAIKVKCSKCGETGIRQDQKELARSNKCRACGGKLEIQKGSIMDVPIESLVKTGVEQIGGMVKKKQEQARKNVESSFEKINATLELILVEQKKHTKMLESLGGTA